MYDVEKKPMPKSRGFSLIEVAIVLTVMAILSTAIVPGLLATARNNVTETMARNINDLHEAITAYYYQNKDWPGQPDPENNCRIDDESDPLKILKDKGYINAPLRDPFSNELYSLNYTLVDDATCKLQIHTPRNERLSALLPGMQNTLRQLVGEPVCNKQNYF